MDNFEWQCRIDEGMAGLSGALWAPDSRRVLTICNFNVRLTIWSLIDRSNSYILFPKYSDKKGISFTSNGLFMALAERRDSKDHIGIYYTADWTLVAHFQVDSYDMQDLQWAKDNTALIVSDSLLECRFYVYSPTGSLIAVHEPYSMSLGIKTLRFSPNGHYLTVGFYDQAMRIYNHITWKNIIDLPHPQAINDVTNINIFREEELSSSLMTNFNSQKTTKYVEVKSAVKFHVVKPNMDKPSPSVGVSEISWSFDSNFVATKNGNDYI